MEDFTHFGLAGPIMLALERAGHKTPTPIQAGAIAPLMEGADLLGIAQTGTGKTAAFALPVLHRLSQNPAPTRPGCCRVLVLAPTRELAAQVLENFRAYGKDLRLSSALVIGGASINKQKMAIRAGVDILVATPGRLVDLMEQGAASLDGVETFILDEVDQMLDLGFIHAIRAIAAALPAHRQNIFFSATMPAPIARLADSLLRDPVHVRVTPTERPKIDESVMFVHPNAKPSALVGIVARDDFMSGIVFTRTKHGADKVVRILNAAGAPAFAIHGNRSQSQRERALEAFRRGKARILVATDIAARGIDIAGVSHVVNYDLPNIPETYVHRIGRTARAGAAGIAISFCSPDERAYLKSIEKLRRQRIFVVAAPEGAAAFQPAAEEERSDERNERRERPAYSAKKKPHRGARANAPRREDEKRTEKSDHGGDGKPGDRNKRARPKHRAKRGPADQKSAPVHSNDALQPTKPQRHAAKADDKTSTRETKGKDHGERGTARIRRRRHRGSAGRELSRAAG